MRFATRRTRTAGFGWIEIPAPKEHSLAKSSNPPDLIESWEAGWDGHALAQLRRLARLPLSEKLRWLEEAHQIVRHLNSEKPGPKRERPLPPA
jgi:hypothetical protein